MSKAAAQTERSDEIRNVVEAAVRKLQNLFEEEGRPESKEIRAALKTLETDFEDRGVNLCQIGKGYRFQTRDKYSPWMRRMRDTRPPRYSRALLETLSIIAYRQPVTRGDIEKIRGVAVSSDIMRVLLDREWINQVGHRDVPGRPALYATTSAFLEYFNLRSLSDLPTLLEPRDISEVAKELNITLPVEEADDADGHEADVIGVDADGVPLDADEEDEEALSAEEDRRIEERRAAADEEINESLAEIDEDLAAVPKITKKSIDKLMGIEDESADAKGKTADGDSPDQDSATSDAPSAEDGGGVMSAETPETTPDASDTSDSAAARGGDVRLVSDASVTAAVTQSLAGVSAGDLGGEVDFDDSLEDVGALNPVVHNVGIESDDDASTDVSENASDNASQDASGNLEDADSADQMTESSDHPGEQSSDDSGSLS